MKSILICVSFFLFICGITHAATAHCDFNNDGFDDLAVGVPNETVNGHTSAGAVNVLYGKATGLSAANNQFWNKDSANVLGATHDYENFGSALACGDFNGDGVGDLAIGDFLAEVNGKTGAGSVTILYGLKNWRLSATGNQLWTQDSPGIPDQAEFDDRFGYSLAAGDFNGDGFSDLAIGVVTETDETIEGLVQGAVHVLYGSNAGLSSTGNQFWTQDSPGVPDASEQGDEFGTSLVAADFGKDTASNCYDDLAIGVPHEQTNVLGDGAVHVLYGSASGLSTTGTQLWREDNLGIPVTIFGDDLFGETLAAGNFRATDSVCGAKKIADLVVGATGKVVFGENGGGGNGAGAVFVVYGTNAGLAASSDNQMWTQGSPGIAENPERLEFFGQAVATGHLTTGDYLVIGVPSEGVGKIKTAGAIHILYTDPSTGLITATGSKFYHQDTTGIKDTDETEDHFGWAVATGDFNADGNDDLAVGVPFEDLSGVQDVGAINVLYSADKSVTQFFHQNSPDIKDQEETFDSFGMSLSH
jgi:hypothetical protein